jgi:hypothetical protein
MARKSRARSRQAAENRIAARRAKRATAAARRAADDAAVRVVLAGSKLAPARALDAVFWAAAARQLPPQQARFGELYGLLIGAPETARVARYRRLLHHLLDVAPRLVHEGWFEPLWALSAAQWRTTGDAWRPKSRGQRAVFLELADLLVVRYSVPRFLYSSLEHGPGPDGERLVRLFVALAQGSSLRREAKALIPAPLTRAMLNRFLQAPADTPVLHAIRDAQVHELGGGGGLVGAVRNSVLGARFVPHEHLMQEAIGWLARHPAFSRNLVPELVDFLLEQRHVRNEYRLVGRTPRSVTEQIRRWRREQRSVQDPSAVFPPSRVDLPRSADAGWTVQELGSGAQLLTEGRAMRHCVATYAGPCRTGRTAIFSLQHRGGRRLTVEVNLRRHAVVQARGVCNRRPDPEERAALSRWAAFAGLALRY